MSAHQQAVNFGFYLVSSQIDAATVVATDHETARLRSEAGDDSTRFESYVLVSPEGLSAWNRQLLVWENDLRIANGLPEIRFIDLRGQAIGRPSRGEE